MPKADKARESKKGASNAFNGLKKGSTFDVNGCRAGINKMMTGSSTSPDDPTVSSKTVKGSDSINQHKKLAMTGHT